MSAIQFADVTLGQEEVAVAEGEMDDLEAIQFETRMLGDGACQV